MTPGIPSSRDETGKYVAVLSPEKHQKIAYKQHEKVSTDVFQCLQLSGETLATESSAAVVISPSSEHLVPDSPKQGTSAIGNIPSITECSAILLTNIISEHG